MQPLLLNCAVAQNYSPAQSYPISLTQTCEAFSVRRDQTGRKRPVRWYCGTCRDWLDVPIFNLDEASSSGLTEACQIRSVTCPCLGLRQGLHEL